jgi:hypothetical protein
VPKTPGERDAYRTETGKRRATRGGASSGGGPTAGAPDELADDDEGGGEEEVEIDDGLELLGAASELAVAVHPAVEALNGLITNDKFCLTRHVSLFLRWRSRGGTAPRAAHG